MEGQAIFLSSFTWNYKQAEIVSDGLGAYLGRLYGKTGLHKYFSEDHWQTMTQWVWNKHEKEFDPPELRTTANNILHDPNARVMEQWYDKQQKILMEERKQQEKNKSKREGDTNENENNEDNKQTNMDVNSLRNRNNDTANIPVEQEEANIDNYIQQSESIRDMAKSIQSGYVSVSSSSSNVSTFTNLKKHRAYEIMQAEKCEDMDSINDPENNVQAGVKTIIQSQDKRSVSSSITGITDNTGNTANISYKVEEVSITGASNNTPTSSLSSLHSFK